MCTRDEVRAAVRSFNKGDWTRNDVKAKLPKVTKYAMEKELAYMEKTGEIKKCGEMTLRTGGRRIFYREVKLLEKYKRPEIERKAEDLKGMRKVWPQYFTDPRIPGLSLFIDNGLRQ